ncbi:uncharacterized protein DUF2630 [Actinocorallia herbida]|uniref:Uncharacterized protein DUF2630 n=1 Tax=Actinocorallia herbida TaxID=58109 RepID=A0A3N1D0C3_9ACTN|nr:DUF2630 family protein [Actinocorallia herbida]ROO86488.1 uncharacterized protein DUF2630 [Actinocorallia herbida]
MSDEQILDRIKRMIDEEHELRTSAEPGHAARVKAIEEELDVCWDLLRQRRAAREYGANPGEAHSRPVGEVEGYQQ